MRIAYLLLVHRDPGQVARLVRALDVDDAFFVVHVDRKATGVMEPLQREFGDHSRLEFAPRRSIDWGMVHVAALAAMRSALRVRPDFLITLSGQDFPLRANHEIFRSLSEHQGRSFLEYAPLDQDGLSMFGRHRVATNWYRVKGHYVPVPGHKQFRSRPLTWLWNKTVGLPAPRRRFLPGLRPFGGSSWFCLSGHRAAATLAYVDAHPEILRFYNRAFLPDEQFFQTVIANGRCDDVISRNLHYVDWTGSHAHPITLTEAHLSDALSSDRLFARKFDAGSPALDILDGHLRDLSHSEICCAGAETK